MATGYGRVDVKSMRNETSSNRTKLEGEYTLTEGKHLIRFLPPTEDGAFYFKYFGHYLPSNDYVICPKHTWQGACPVCVLADNLFRSRDPDEIAQGRKLYRKPSYIANIVDVRAPDEGVQIVRFGRQIRDQLVNFFTDPDDEADEGIDITDPEKGATVRITVTPPEEGGFRKYIAALGKQGPVPYKKWLAKTRDLQEIIKKLTKSKDELRKLITDALDEDIPGTDRRGRPANGRDDDWEETKPLKPKGNSKPVVDDDDDDGPTLFSQKTKATRMVDDEDDDLPKPTAKTKALADDDEPAPKPNARSSKPARRSFAEEEDDD